MGEHGLIMFINEPDHLETWSSREINFLPEFRREKGLRYRFSKDRVRSVVAFCLLSSMLGFVPQSFVYNENEKPFLEEGVPLFSITHSDNCVAVAISKFDVGIDSEALRKCPKEVMTNVFTKKEISMIENSQDEDNTFFKIWTLKESYIKALGRGFSFPLKDVEFLIENEMILCSDSSFTFSTFSVGNSQLSVCGSEKFSLKEIGHDELKCKWESLKGRL